MVAVELERRIRETGERLYRRVESDKPSAFKIEYWSGKAMDWAMRDPAFKTQLFRFVDVFPSLQDAADIASHLREYFDRPGQNLPDALEWGVRNLNPGSMAAKIVARGVGKNIEAMAGQFIAGAALDDALPELEKIRRQGAAFSISLLGEAVVSDEEADAYASKYIEMFDRLETHAKRWAPLGGGANGLDWGVTPPVNISIKPSAMDSQMHAEAPEAAVGRAKERLRPILRRAIAAGAFVHFDMEHRELKNLTLALYKSILEEPEFAGYPHTGIAIQTYLRESRQDLEELLDWSSRREQPLTVRVIKGAYWDTELVEARQNNWPLPVWSHKAETDAAFEDAARLTLGRHRLVRTACGSHNLRSLAYVRELGRELGAPGDRVEYQVLFGMADPIRNALLEEGLPVRMYTPVGELVPGMAYLVRRLLENTANESFLRRSFSAQAPKDELLADPREQVAKLARNGQPAEPLEPPAEAFLNEPLLDWTLAETRERFAQALKTVRRQFPLQIPLMVAGERRGTDERIESVNPNKSSEVVASVSRARPEDAQAAVTAAKKALPAWRGTDPAERAAFLSRAAQAARKRRYELAALQVFETGKSWREADADVCEAIDFFEYYGRQMLALAKPRRMGHVPGEDSFLFYEPRGVAAVIAPWNFPLAISAGMTSAALVTGNTVVYKPAEESSAVGHALAEIYEEAGVPKGVFNFVPGDGPEIGGLLVEHPDVAMIAFTGSREVGLEIMRRAAASPGPETIKHVIAELGGKNAIVVDTGADFDDAIAGVIHSAFAYQGQKCSACSRLILPEAIHDAFLGRLAAAARSLPLGPVEVPQNVAGAVISREALDKVERYVEMGKRDCRTAVERRYQGVEGFFPPLAIFADVAPDHPLAQEEIFGPVIAVIRAKDFDGALRIANGTRYALTGAVYTRSPKRIEQARQEFRVGNLYINRGSTGAIVGRHPFGGFKMSGAGTKAGGPDYLLQFTVPRCATENTTRRGFTPDVG